MPTFQQIIQANCGLYTRLDLLTQESGGGADCKEQGIEHPVAPLPYMKSIKIGRYTEKVDEQVHFQLSNTCKY
ncbi:hypothetical protein DNHGIG_34870 [Collibacillus ludicampi]|uniref:Uncharacterized protein n=1 Tax=Collibacillus ludicampi TaxID=2771369 RepID=A0AAV4LJZ5_9BACL|nr:hypothetical protein DNHGIG_34870 [Collibacillus ludicampi]